MLRVNDRVFIVEENTMLPVILPNKKIKQVSVRRGEIYVAAFTNPFDRRGTLELLKLGDHPRNAQRVSQETVTDKFREKRI